MIWPSTGGPVDGDGYAGMTVSVVDRAGLMPVMTGKRRSGQGGKSGLWVGPGTLRRLSGDGIRGRQQCELV